MSISQNRVEISDRGVSGLTCEEPIDGFHESLALRLRRESFEQSPAIVLDA